MTQIVQVKAGKTNVSVGRRLLTALDKTVISAREFNRLTPTFLNNLDDLGPGIFFTAPVLLTAVTPINTVLAPTITPGFAGRITNAFAIVSVAGAGAGAVAAVQVMVDADGAGAAVAKPIGGGVIGLTLANTATVGACIAASRVGSQRINTASFGKLSVISFKTTATAITVFTAGAVIFGVEVGPDVKDGPISY